VCFIQIRFLWLPFYTNAFFCVYKRPSKLLLFYNLVHIFISHTTTPCYQLVLIISMSTTTTTGNLSSIERCLRVDALNRHIMKGKGHVWFQHVHEAVQFISCTNPFPSGWSNRHGPGLVFIRCAEIITSFLQIFKLWFLFLKSHTLY
jgi:hypothetical protein